MSNTGSEDDAEKHFTDINSKKRKLEGYGSDKSDKQYKGRDGADGQDEKPDWSRLDADAIEVLTRVHHWQQPRTATESARGGISLPDVVQEAITELIEKKVDLQTHQETVDEVVIRARRRWKSWRKKILSQGRNLDRLRPTTSPRDMFEIVCARDEHMKFITRLYEAFENEPEAKQVIYALLERGFNYHETKLIADDVGTSENYVTNLKRRIERRAEKIMIELTSAHKKGGQA